MNLHGDMILLFDDIIILSLLSRYNAFIDVGGF